SVRVTDDKLGPICSTGPMAVGASTSCTQTGSAVKGQYENTGTAAANIDTLTSTGEIKTVTVTARDIDHYFGADPNVAIVKKTLGTDNNVPPGPIKLVGSPVQWTYSVTNTGNVPLVDLTVTDDKEGPV